MPDHLYLVRLSCGRGNSDYQHFLENVSNLKAKAPDFGGIQGSCLLMHHVDVETIKMLCAEGLKNEDDVSVEEITDETLRKEHVTYRELVDRYFRPYGRFEKLGQCVAGSK